MNKLKILFALGILFFSVFSLSFVSAYSHAYFQLSDNLVFREDIKGENRGFSLRRSVDVPRLTPSGYYDWSYMPIHAVYQNPDSYKISDRLASQAFKTFSADSRDQSKIELERQKNRYRSYGYFGSYYPRYYRYWF